MFNPAKERQHIVNWIGDWFHNHSGNAQKIVIGMSGGKDSLIAAALCGEAVGTENVVGIMMPNGELPDADAMEACLATDVRTQVVPIHTIYRTFVDEMKRSLYFDLDKQTRTNIPPRLRMTVLYAAAQAIHGRVCGTSNASEAYVGYCTKGGDLMCDFAPLKNYTAEEVIAIGDTIKYLPHHLVHKTPEDGLSGLTDEENMGVTYSQISAVMRGEPVEQSAQEKITRLHQYNLHKTSPIPCCPRSK